FAAWRGTRDPAIRCIEAPADVTTRTHPLVRQSLVPHSPQNLIPGCVGAEHFGQAVGAASARGVPHCWQNFAVPSAAPHAPHIAAAPTGATGARTTAPADMSMPPT